MDTAAREESRDSLDLLASAAAESSPQNRIKRNTACVSCRDSKVKCNASATPGQPCQRCTKLRLECVVDKSHKRISKRSKLEELVQEVQSIRDAVASKAAGVGSSAIPQLPLPPLPDVGGLVSPQADLTRPYMGLLPLSNYGMSTSMPPTPNMLGGYSTPATVAAAATAAMITPGQTTTTPSTTAGPAGQPTEARALGSRVIAGQDIDFYFDKYFELFHPYMPIVRMREPDAVYKASSTLFWAIVVTACRRYALDDSIYQFLVTAVREEIWKELSETPLSLATMNALLIMCTWPLTAVRLLRDSSAIYASMVLNSCFLLGIHTGAGDYGARNYPHYQIPSSTNEEALYTWAAYNIITQRISTYAGTPSIGMLFNNTLESILDGSCKVSFPSHVIVSLSAARFLSRLSKTMAAALEDSVGVSHRVVALEEETFERQRRLINAEMTDVDYFIELSALLECQVYYFLPLPGFSHHTFRTNILRCHTTAKAVVQLALKLESEQAFISHGPHFICHSLFTAACVGISVALSLVLRDYMTSDSASGGSGGDELAQSNEALVHDAIAASRACSVHEGDLPMRVAKMMENAWRVRHLLAPTEVSQLGGTLGEMEAPRPSTLSMPLDCLRRWKRQMSQMRMRAKSVTPSGLEGDGPQSTIDPNIEPALMDGTTAAAAAARLDWDAFMADFDWAYDPTLLSMMVI